MAADIVSTHFYLLAGKISIFYTITTQNSWLSRGVIKIKMKVRTSKEKILLKKCGLLRNNPI